MAALLSGWLAFAGLFWLAATLRRHASALGADPRRHRLLKLGGWALLALAPAPWALAFDLPMALVAWSFCTLPLAGVAVVLALAYAPRAGAVLSGAALLLPRTPRAPSRESPGGRNASASTGRAPTR